MIKVADKFDKHYTKHAKRKHFRILDYSFICEHYNYKYDSYFYYRYNAPQD